MHTRRFVILEHHHEGVHYDLMVEVGAALRTWRLDRPPADSAQEAIQSFDHRLAYLDYEGPISEGRGHVVRWDAGTFEGDPSGDTHLRLHFSGARLQGDIILQAIHAERWEVMYSPDEKAVGSRQQAKAD